MEKVKKKTLRSARAVARSGEGQEAGSSQNGVNGTQQHDEYNEGSDGEDAEDEEEEERDEEEDGGSPKGRKRARANTNGDSHPSQSEPKRKAKVEKYETHPRDVDGFIPGSIVRVQLKNFVTYDWVEFTPGPYLNMILGPNGTGKSSIACAICLGLNFPPSVLGRATEITSFVKIGTENGHIEIELKGPSGQPNLIIRRTISSKSKSSQFTLNGEHVSGKEVMTKMAELNVQVSNLCSFLPQDKVAEFARMSPQQLLRETQRAAGNVSLTAWHDTLIASGKELKQLQEQLTTDRDHLHTMEQRNENLERDVKKYEERKQLEADLALVELLLPFREYLDAREHWDAAKKAAKELQDKVNKLKDKNLPMQNTLKTWNAKQKELEQHRDAKKAACKKKHNALNAKWTQNETLEAEAEDLKSRLEHLKSAEKKRLADIKTYEKKIQELKAYLAGPPEIEDINVINEEHRKVRAESRRMADKNDDLQERQKALVEEQGKYQATINSAERSLLALESEAQRKFAEIKHHERDLADAVDWIRDHKDKFRMEVFEPPILSCTVPNKAYATPVEALMSRNQLRTIVAQCEEDYQTINRMLCDSGDAIGRKVRLNTFFRAYREDLDRAPPMSREELMGLGFDGYALDFIQCPEGLKWFLKIDCQLHRSAIGLDRRRVNTQGAMDLISSRGGASFIVENVMNQVTRSRYGKRLAQNSTREIRAASQLVSTAVDPQIKRQHEQALTLAKEELTKCQQRGAELAQEEAEIRAQHKTLSERNKALEARRRKVDNLKGQIQTAEVKLRMEEEKLERVLKAPPVDEERASTKKKILNIAAQRSNLVNDYGKLVKAAIQDQILATKLGLEYLQMGANIAQLQKIYDERSEDFKKVLDAFQKARTVYENAKVLSREKLTESKDMLMKVDDATRAKFEQMEANGEANARDVEQLKDAMEDIKQKLDMASHTNAGIIETYRKRCEEIKILKETIEEREQKIQKKERSIKIARDSWEPALQELVSSVGEKFSAAFDRIGCAGEIKITPHEDYDKWAIDILVKFRDNEKLQLLTGERQSGGERSLTTILYLMSLTEEARTPFSLVDEINQGMDARAERAVHNSLVEVTCKAESGQYFLITPKLLPDLKYHERMKILCVNNGEWLPEDGGIGNMMGMIEGYLRQKNNNRSNAAA
ncbi:P-loop containing nucleoside triphosphate hydrolase protein [Abortiporus biennis]|nr:P-loop containing nucleoside triphosphate hydrolase protein [Abortiporus biennis]